MTEIKIESKIDVKEYIRLVFILTYRRRIIRILILLGFILLLWGILSLCNIWYSYGILTYAQLFLAVFILGFLPFVFYHRAIRNYNSNERLKEIITYVFSEKQIIIRGESFHVEMDWEKTFKIEEIKNWFLIFQNINSANIIPKRCFNDESLINFRNLIHSKNLIIRN